MREKLSSTAGISFGFQAWYAAASAWPATWPCTTICEPVPLWGFSSTGFMCTLGGTPQARACTACARPISPPSAVTAALFDMFCGLEGAHPQATPREGAAQPGDDQRLADVGPRALDHESAGHASRQWAKWSSGPGPWPTERRSAPASARSR